MASEYIVDNWSCLKAGDFVYVVANKDVTCSFTRYMVSLNNPFLNIFHVKNPEEFSPEDHHYYAVGPKINVVICSSVDGDVPAVERIILLAPDAAISQFESMRCGPKAIIGVMPLDYERYDAYIGLRNLFWRYCIRNAPHEVCKSKPKLWLRHLRKPPKEVPRLWEFNADVGLAPPKALNVVVARLG